MDRAAAAYESSKFENIGVIFSKPRSTRQTRPVPYESHRIDARRPLAVQPESQTDAVGDLQEQIEFLREDVEWVKQALSTIMSKLDGEDVEGEPTDRHDMTASQIKNLILEKVGHDKPFYPSDIAMEFELDFDAVLEAITMLRDEGRIIDQD